MPVDRDEQQLWFQAYMKAGLRFAPLSESRSSIAKWARSMAKIAEQHENGREEEPAEVDA